MQNIADWNLQNEVGPVDTVNPEVDPWDDRLSSGLEALRDSEAYNWLISAVRREVKLNGIDPHIMRCHRKELLRELESIIANSRLIQSGQSQKISRHRKPDLYTATFVLEWDIPGFLLEQDYSENVKSHVLGRVITLTGDQMFSQALPCREYMQQVWPTTGLEFLQLFESLLEQPSDRQESKFRD
jgi:hypothetical protein